MTEPPEGPSQDEGPEEVDWQELAQNAARDFVADATPDMRETIDRLRDELGDEAFDAAVAEVLRRANDPMRYTEDLEALQEDEDFETLDDDMFLDQLGSGAVFPPADEPDLTDLLGAWRDDVESVPPPPGTDPEVLRQIHDFTEELDRATAPPPAPSTPGGTPAMTAMEDAQQIRNLGEAAKNRALSALNAIEAALDGLVKQAQEAASGPDEFAQHAQNILGGDHPGVQAIYGSVGGWADALAPLVQHVTEMRNAVADAQGGANGLQEGFNAVAATLSGGGS